MTAILPRFVALLLTAVITANSVEVFQRGPYSAGGSRCAVSLQDFLGQPAMYLAQGSLAPCVPLLSRGDDEMLHLGTPSDDPSRNVPALAQRLGTATVVLPGNHEVVFTDIALGASDVSQSSTDGWSAAMLAKLDGDDALPGVLLAIVDDVAVLSSALKSDEASNTTVLGNGVLENLRQQLSALWETTNESVAQALGSWNVWPSSLVAAVLTEPTAGKVHIVTPLLWEAGKKPQIVSFHAPQLFDGLWHLFGLTFEPLALGRYLRIALHVDGNEPSSRDLLQCRRMYDAQSVPVFPHTAIVPTSVNASAVLWNRGGGAIAFGGTSGEYHSLVLYQSVLSRQSIASLGTQVTRENAAGMRQGQLLGLGGAFVAFSIVLIVWSIAHAANELRGPEVNKMISVLKASARVLEASARALPGLVAELSQRVDLSLSGTIARRGDVTKENDASSELNDLSGGGNQLPSVKYELPQAPVESDDNAAQLPNCPVEISQAAKQDVPLVAFVASDGLLMDTSINKKSESVSFIENAFHTGGKQLATSMKTAVDSATSMRQSTSAKEFIDSRGDVRQAVGALGRHGGKQIINVLGVTLSAASSMKAAAAPIAKTSASVIVAVTSLGLQVPQQMSVLLTSMTFPDAFKTTFNNFFDMVSIKFDFPEVNVPPYAPLIVVLVLLALCVMLMAAKAFHDRIAFEEALARWRDGRIAYEILIRYVVHEAVTEQHIGLQDREVRQLVDEEEERDIIRCITAKYPTPAGRIGRTFISENDTTSDTTTDELASGDDSKLLLRLKSACGTFVSKSPHDAVESMVMCFTVVMHEALIRPVDVETIALKLRTVFDNFDLIFRRKVTSILSLPVGMHDAPELLGAVVDQHTVEVAEGCSAAKNTTIQHYRQLSTGQRKAFALELMNHVTSLIVAVLGWAMDVDESTVDRFITPFVELYLNTRGNGNNTGNGVFESLDESTAAHMSQLTVEQRAAAFRIVMRRQTQSGSGSELRPPHDSRSGHRKFEWVNDSPDRNSDDNQVADAQPTRPLDAWEVRSEYAKMMTKGGQHSGKRIRPVCPSRCCPSHDDLLVPATEEHYAAVSLDGRKIYRCCNADMEVVKSLLHGKKHQPGDECDEGSLYVCSEVSCGFAMCDRCLRREVSWRHRNLYIPIAGLWYTLVHMNPPLLGVLALLVMEGLLFPVTQIPILVLSCSPKLACWLSSCYEVWNAEFKVSVAISVALLVLRVFIAVGMWSELRIRKARCVALFSAAGNYAGGDLEERNTTWQHFMHFSDRSLLRSVYMGTELDYIALDPLMKLFLDIGVVCASSLPPTDSAAQKAAVGIVYGIYGILLATTNPNLLLSLDVLAKAVIIHQLLTLGLTSIHLGLSIEGENSQAMDAVVVVMVLVTLSFILFAGFTIWRQVIQPFQRSIRDFEMGKLIRRDAQVSLMSDNKSELLKRIKILFRSLMRKRRLQHLVVLPWQEPPQADCQTAITASLLLESLDKAEAAWGHDTKGLYYVLLSRGSPKAARLTGRAVDSVIETESEMMIEKCKTFLGSVRRHLTGLVLSWLRENTTEVNFFGFEVRLSGRIVPSGYSATDPFSLASRQLLPHEVSALAYVLKRELDGNKDILSKLTRCSNVFNSTFLACNLLQLLTAAGVTEKLSFTKCNLRTARIPAGTRFTNCNFCETDFSFVGMPKCSFGRCKLQGANIGLRNSFHGRSAQYLMLPAKGRVRCVAFSPDGTFMAAAVDSGFLQLWNSLSGAELWSVRHADATCVCFSPDSRRLACGSDDETVRVFDVITGVEQFILNKSYELSVVAHLKPSADGSCSISSFGTERKCTRDAHQEMSAEVTCVAYSPDGMAIVIGSKDRCAWVYPVGHGSIGKTKRLKHSFPVVCVAVSPDGQWIVCGSDRYAVVWPIGSEGEPRVVRHGKNKTEMLYNVFLQQTKSTKLQVSAVAIAPSGEQLVTSIGAEICLWKFDKGIMTFLQSLPTGSEPTLSVAYSPDGSRLVSCGRQGTVTIWDAESCSVTCVLVGHRGAARSVTFSHDGSRVLSGSDDATVRLWDPFNEELTTNNSSMCHTSDVNSVLFSGAGERDGMADVVVSASEDNTIRFWDSLSGREVRPALALEGVKSVQESTDGSLLIACAPNAISVYRTTTLEKLTTLWPTEQHTADALCVTVAPDTSFLASGHEDNEIRLWSIDDEFKFHQTTHRLRGHENAVRCLCFVPPETNVDPETTRRQNKVISLISGSDDTTAIVWEIEVPSSQVGTADINSKQRLHLKGGHTGFVTGCAAQRVAGGDGQVATCSQDGTIIVWNLSNGAILHTLRGHPKAVLCITFSPMRFRELASGGSDGTVRCWDTSSGSEVRLFRGHSRPVKSVAYSHDGRYIASGSEDQSVRLWKVHGGGFEILELLPKVVRVQPKRQPQQRRVSLVRRSPSTAASTSVSRGMCFTSTGIICPFERSVVIVPVDSAVTTPQPLRSPTAILCMALSLNERILAAGGEDGTLSVWELARSSQEPQQVFKGHVHEVTTLCWTMQNALVSGGVDQEVRLWPLSDDRSPGQEVISFRTASRLHRHSRKVFAVAAAATVDLIASGGADSTVFVWNAEGRQQKRFQKHNNTVRAIAFSADGAYLVSGGEDKTIVIVHLPTDTIRCLRQHSEVIASLSFSSKPPTDDSSTGSTAVNWFVSGSADGDVRMWHAATGAEVHHLCGGHTGTIASACFSPDNRCIASCEGDVDNPRIRLWFNVDVNAPSSQLDGMTLSLVEASNHCRVLLCRNEEELCCGPGGAEFQRCHMTSV